MKYAELETLFCAHNYLSNEDNNNVALQRKRVKEKNM